MVNKKKADEGELAAAKLFHKSTFDAQRKVNEDILNEQELLKNRRIQIIEKVGVYT